MIARSWLLPALLAAPLAALAEPELSLSAPEHGKAASADASPVDVGVVEAELGFAPAWNDLGAAGYTHALAATVTLGVARDLDLRVSAGLATTDDGTRGLKGATDLTLGARWRFLDLPRHALELAVTGDVVVPVGVHDPVGQLGLTQGFWSFRGALVATKDFGRLTATGELAVCAPLSGAMGGHDPVAQVNAAAGYQLLGWLQPELELNFTHGASHMSGAEVLAVTAGVVAPLPGGSRVMAAVQQGVWARNAVPTTGGVVAFKLSL